MKLKFLLVDTMGSFEVAPLQTKLEGGTTTSILRLSESHKGMPFSLQKESEARGGGRSVLWAYVQLAASKERSSLSPPPNKIRTNS